MSNYAVNLENLDHVVEATGLPKDHLLSRLKLAQRNGLELYVTQMAGESAWTVHTGPESPVQEVWNVFEHHDSRPAGVKYASEPHAYIPTPRPLPPEMTVVVLPEPASEQE